jgi:hypothetical protein
MKKVILVIVVMLITGSISMYANKKEEINKQVVASFSKDFKGAQNVVWQQLAQCVKASFECYGQIMSAYYAEDGKLLAVSRNVLSDHLPILLLLNLKKNYSHYWISDLVEMNSEGETAWYVRLESADETVILKSGAYNHWAIDKKIKKQ